MLGEVAFHIQGPRLPVSYGSVFYEDLHSVSLGLSKLFQ